LKKAADSSLTIIIQHDKPSQACPDIHGHACDECGLHRPPILTTETRDRLQPEVTVWIAQELGPVVQSQIWVLFRKLDTKNIYDAKSHESVRGCFAPAIIIAGSLDSGTSRLLTS
jgi:hypothetical protein